jgi:hypothetical protein
MKELMDWLGRWRTIAGLFAIIAAVIIITLAMDDARQFPEWEATGPQLSEFVRIITVAGDYGPIVSENGGDTMLVVRRDTMGSPVAIPGGRR